MNLEIHKNEGPESQSQEVSPEVSPEVSKNEIINFEEELRLILKDIPNKNALYKKLGLNQTYLNLKNFINGKEEHLKEKGLNAFLEKIGYVKIPLYIRKEDIPEDIINLINLQYQETLQSIHEFIEPVFEEKGRRKAIFDENDVQAVKDIIEHSLSQDVSDIEDFNNVLESLLIKENIPSDDIIVNGVTTENIGIHPSSNSQEKSIDTFEDDDDEDDGITINF
jgi:hypothetical protein